MAEHVVRVRPGPDAAQARRLRAAIAGIQEELGVSAEFSPEVDAAARASAERPRLPDLDRTELPFVTVDPAGSRDLDQALHLERIDRGYVVHYAIADLAAFVTAGDVVDREAHRRGETLYGADASIPLHPRAISEGAGSLLPDQVRPALLWTIEMDGDGRRRSARVERALVRSRAQWDYAQVQRAVDAGTADDVFVLLREVGRLRMAREAARGGISLPLPDQEIAIDGERWRLEFRDLVPAEQWNAQLSLLTGFAAAAMMLEAKVGLLRTLPPAQQRDLDRLRRTAGALRVPWPEGMAAADLIRSLDPARPRHAALLEACTRLLRGSGYAGFDGTLPEETSHAGLAAPYAHVTAPLRRLADRYASEVCVSLCAGVPVPDWVAAELDTLPDVMRQSSRRSGSYERAILDLVEAAVLRHRVGEEFPGVVVELDREDPRRGEIVIPDPAVAAPIRGSRPLPLGAEVTARLVRADVDARKVEFALE